MLKVTLISIILIIGIVAFALCARAEHTHYTVDCDVCKNTARIEKLEKDLYYNGKPVVYMEEKDEEVPNRVYHTDGTYTDYNYSPR